VALAARVNALLRMFNPENGDGSLHLELSRSNASGVESGEWLLENSGVSVRDRRPIHAWIEETPNRDMFSSITSATR